MYGRLGSFDAKDMGAPKPPPAVADSEPDGRSPKAAPCLALRALARQRDDSPPSPVTLTVYEASPEPEAQEADRDRVLKVLAKWLKKDEVRRLGTEIEDPTRDRIYRQLRLLILVLSWLGVMNMIICQLVLPDLEVAHRFDALWGFTLALQISVVLLTAMAILVIVKYYVTVIRYTKQESIIPTIGPQPQWSFRHSKLPLHCFGEIFVHIWMPIPFFYQRALFLSVWMFLRVYLLFSVIKLYSPVYRRRFDIFGTKGKKKKQKYEVHFDMAMVFRVLLFTRIGVFFVGLAVITIVLGTFAIMIAEFQDQPALGGSWLTSFWFTAFNFLTVGNPLFPVTDLGKVVLFVIVGLGLIANQLFGAIMTNKLTPTPIQEMIIEFMDVQHKTERYRLARVRVVQIIARQKWRKRPPTSGWTLGRALAEMRLARSEYETKADKPDLTTKLDTCLDVMEKVVQRLSTLKEVAENIRKNTTITKAKVNKFHNRNTENFADSLRLLERNHEMLQGLDPDCVFRQAEAASGTIDKQLLTLRQQIQHLNTLGAVIERLEAVLKQQEATEDERVRRRLKAHGGTAQRTRALEKRAEQQLEDLTRSVETSVITRLQGMERRMETLEEEATALQAQQSETLQGMLTRQSRLEKALDAVAERLEHYAPAPIQKRFPPGHRPTLGIEAKWYDDEVGGKENVCIIDKCTQDGPGDAAGLMEGDRIVTWNGLAVKSKRKFEKFFSYLEPESFVILGIERGEDLLELPVAVGSTAKGRQKKRQTLSRRGSSGALLDREASGFSDTDLTPQASTVLSRQRSSFYPSPGSSTPTSPLIRQPSRPSFTRKASQRRTWRSKSAGSDA